MTFWSRDVPGNRCFYIATRFDHQPYLLVVTSDHVLQTARKKYLQQLMSSQELCCLGRRLPAESIFGRTKGFCFTHQKAACGKPDGHGQHTADSKRFRQQRHPETLSAAASLPRNAAWTPQNTPRQGYFPLFAFYWSRSNWKATLGSHLALTQLPPFAERTQPELSQARRILLFPKLPLASASAAHSPCLPFHLSPAAKISRL